MYVLVRNSYKLFKLHEKKNLGISKISDIYYSYELGSAVRVKIH